MKAFDLDLAAFKHLEWKARLRAFLEGKGCGSADEFTSPRACELGRWFNEGGILTNRALSETRELLSVHEEIHRMARQALEARNAGRSAEALAHLESMEPVTARLLALLKSLQGD